MSVIIFTHGDSDGICSGALALAANPDAQVYFTSPVSILADLDRANHADMIVVCDIAVNLASAAALKKRLDELSTRMGVAYIDHHPLPTGFSAKWLVHDPGSCGSLLTFKYFIDRLDPDLSRVALYGAIGDYRDDSPMAAEIVGNWDKRSLYYQAGTLSQGIEMGRRDYDYKRSLTQYLSRNVLPSNIQSLAENAIKASQLEDELRLRIEKDVVRMKNISYVVNPNGFISKAAIYAHVYGRTPVGVACEYRAGKDAYDVSVRAVGDYNLHQVVGQAAARYGGTGGGHPQAAGARIPASRLMDFLGALDASLRQPAGKEIEAAAGVP